MPIAVRTLPLAVTLLAAAVGGLAAIDPMMAVAGAIGLVFGILMLGDVMAGLCIFAFSAAFFEAIPEFGDFSVAKALGLALALSWIAAVTFRPNLRGEVFTEQPMLSLLLLLLVTWGGLSLLWADDTGEARTNWLRLALNGLLVPIAFSAVREGRTFVMLAWALVGGMLLSAFYGFAFSPGGADAVEGRLGGAGLDPNYLALWLIIAGTLAVGIAARRTLKSGQRWAAAGAAGLCLLAALATASRTGVIALGVALLFAPFVMGQGRRALTTIFVLVAVTGTGVYLVALAPDSVRQHVEDTQGGGSGRTDIWKVGLRMGEAHPVLGVGLGNFRTQSVHYLLEPGTITRSDYIVDQPKAAHNTYLELFAETGGVGLGLYLGLAAFAVGAGLAAARRFAALGRRDDSLMARVVVLATLAGLAGSTFISLLYTKPLWLLLALGPIMLNLARRAEAA